MYSEWDILKEISLSLFPHQAEMEDMQWPHMFVKAVRNQMVPPCAEWSGETVNRAAIPFGYCLSTAFLPVRPHCVNVRWNRCQEDLNCFPWRTGGNHWDAFVLRGWRLSSKTWNPVTSPWMKELMWLRIVHCGDWCLYVGTTDYALLVVQCIRSFITRCTV